MSDIKKNLLIHMIITCLLMVLVGVLLIVLDANLLITVCTIILGAILIALGLEGVLISNKSNVFLVLYILQITLGVLMIVFRNETIDILVGIYLIGLPIARIILNKSFWKDELRKQLPSLILGTCIILFGVGTIANIMLNVTGWILIGLAAIYLILGSISLAKHQ